MPRSARARALIVLGLAAGCPREEPRSPPAAPGGQVAYDAAATDAAPPPRAYPTVSTEARPGEAVMVAVSGDRPLTVVEESARVTFRRAVLVAPGATTSTVSLDGGAPVDAANAVILRFPADAEAARGELVLTASDEAKRGVELARVVTGPARTPVVATLADGFLRVNPGPRRRLAAGSFRRVGEAGAVGSGVAVRVGSGAPVLRFVVRADGDQVLLMRRSGELSVKERAQCLPLPLRPPLAADVTVQATEHDHAFQPMRVVRVDPTTGEVELSFDIARRDDPRTVETSRTITVAAPMYLPSETFPAAQP